ncbi:MAG: hypothetical protein WDA16_04030 [Candidatus Thermoplasmatota archaeon]
MMLVRAALVLIVVVFAGLAGCANNGQSAPPLVAYPKLGDVAVYEVNGAYVEFARWENGHPVAAGTQLRFELAPGGKVLDAARLVHDTFRVTTTLGGTKFSDLYVSPAHEAIVQAVYPLSQDANVVSFDERGYPWLFGASVLFGKPLGPGSAHDVIIPDNLASPGSALVVAPSVPTDVTISTTLPHRLAAAGTLAYAAQEEGATRFDLHDVPGINGSLWMTAASAWPQRVRLTITSDELAPNIRVDGALPATMDARLVTLQAGTTLLPPRDSAATFQDDRSVKRVAWDGEKPPDGDAAYAPYVLSDAVRDAKLLDKGVMDWLVNAQDPRLYRATFKMAALNGTGPLNDTLAPYWLLVWMEKGGMYYQVEMQRIDAPAPPVPLPRNDSLGQGVPRALSSGPVEPPKDKSHGWFPKEAEPADLVPLSEGVRVVRAVFGAQEVQIFLRSFARPPGYSYFLDGGWEKGESGRYTVVYNPGTGLLEEATGPVGARISS